MEDYKPKVLGEGLATGSGIAGGGMPVDFRAAFGDAADGMAVIGMDGRLRVVNRALCEMLGQTEAQLTGLPLDSLMEPDAAELLRGRLRLLESGALRSFRRDCKFRHRRGTDVWVALGIALVRDLLGSPAYLVLQARDITDTKQVERMMLASERRFRTIFNALSEGFIETDTDGRIVDVNDPLCRMVSFGREELIGRPLYRFLEEASRPAMQAQFREGLRTRHRTFELVLIGKRGDRVEAQVYSTTLTDVDGKVTGATAIVLNVTDRNRAQAALRASEQRYRTLVDSIQDGLILVREERFDYVNGPFARMLEYAPGDLIGRPLSFAVAPEDRDSVMDRHRRRLRGEGIKPEYEASYLSRSGRRVLVNVHAAVTRDAEGNALTIATVKDVTERRRIEAELRKLSSAVEHSPASVFITDVNGVIEYVNPKFTEVTGYTAAETVGRTPSLMRSGETAAEVYEDLWSTLLAGRPWRGEFLNKRKDGTNYWELTSISPIRNERGMITHFVAVKEDVTARKEAELLNWRRANFDQVTGLPNRVLFKDRLIQAVNRARRERAKVAVMFIDLDRFKAVNDTLGHETGDLVLRQVAERLTACMRETDTVARLAGDEFTAILPDPGPEKHIATVAQRVVETLRQPFPVGNGQEAFLGGSIGIAVYPDDTTSPSELVKHADTAMYRAKESGRNAFRFFTADMNVAMEHRLKLEADLRRALSERQFAVHFQPVVDAGSRAIKGAEALVRWAHPVRGMVPPGEFLAAAEEIGIIGELGAVVISRACAMCRLWRDAGHGDLTVSVNVSGRQLVAPDFLRIVDTALSDSGLPADALALEVVENLLLSDVPAVEATLRALADRGVRLTIDDFGTGYSSLQHLRRFPFHTLKVDRSFIRDVLESRDDAILVEAVIAMARKLGLAVVAEGVETEDQIDYLLTQYCDMFQGFLFGRALPAEEFEALLAGGPGGLAPASRA